MGILSKIDEYLYKRLKRDFENRIFDKKYPFITREILFFIYLLAFAVYMFLLIFISLLLNKILEDKLDIILNHLTASIIIIIPVTIFLFGSHFLLENYRERNKELYNLGKEKYDNKISKK